MNILLVSFSLRNPQKDYNSFYVAVRGNAVNWLHYIEQTVIVTTWLDANQFALQLIPHIEKSDSLVVAKIEPHEFQGWLPQMAWEWLDDISTKIEAEKSNWLVPPPKMMD